MSLTFFFFKQKTAYELRISDWSSDVCSSDLVASDGLALAASTKRARGWQLGLVRTTANLYGSTAWPVNAPSMRAQASGIWRSVWTTPVACGVAAGRVISGTGSAAKAGSAASSRNGRIGRMGAYTGDGAQRQSRAGRTGNHGGRETRP